MNVIVDEQPAARAAAIIAASLVAAVRDRGAASLALSGGSTAPPMIAALVSTPGLDWSAITIWQVDERVAPDGDPGRNANQLASIPGRVRLMPVTAADRRRAARRYAASLPSRFDVVHLGLGSDGHTASWPPGEPRVATSPRLVELVAMFNDYPRMTLTERVINGARERVILTTGAGKRTIVERWLGGDHSLPISWVEPASATLIGDPPAVGGIAR